MEDALLLLGDGARCRVLVWGAVTSAVGHLKRAVVEKKNKSLDFS